MIVLSNGYKKPETGDFGDVWFPALEDNIDRLNGHSHDGTDSEVLSASAVNIQTQAIVSGDFSLVSGRYRATVTLVNAEVDKHHLSFRDPTTREQIFLEYAYVSDTQIYVYSSIARDFTLVVS